MPPPYVEGPRHYRITADNQGARVLVAAYIMMVNMVLSLIARAGIKFLSTRKWAWDDTVINIAAAFAVGHTGCMITAYNNGLGERVPSGGIERYHNLEKSFYASNVLSFVVIVLAKISILIFIMRLTPSRKARKVCWAFFTFLALWGTASMLCWLFACGLPDPWLFESGSCIDLAAFTRVSTVINITTDLLLVALPVYLFASKLKNQPADRLTVIAVFSVRAFMVVPTIFRVIAVHRAFESSDLSNVAWNAVPFQIWTSVELHFSIITASIPCVRPFLRSLESGLLDSSMRLHPRLERSGQDVEKKFMLMTMGGWSARIGLEKKGPASTTSRQYISQSRHSSNGAESIDAARGTSISSEAEFSRQLHPEFCDHQASIQSSRTFPQYAKSSLAVKDKRDGKNWEKIAITKETRIRFEQGGEILQELRMQASNAGPPT